MAKFFVLLGALVAVAVAVPVEDLGSASSIYTPLQTYSHSQGAIIGGPQGGIVSPGVSTVYSSQGIYRSGIHGGGSYPVQGLGAGYGGINGYGLSYNVIPIAHGVEQRRTVGYYH